MSTPPSPLKWRGAALTHGPNRAPARAKLRAMMPFLDPVTVRPDGVPVQRARGSGFLQVGRGNM